MQAFIVELANQPAVLCRIVEALGAKGINVTAGAGLAWGAEGAFAFLAGNEVEARRILARSRRHVPRGRDRLDLNRQHTRQSWPAEGQSWPSPA